MLLAAKNKSDLDRKFSSSGAVFPLIARKIIRDGGLVYGVAFNENYDVEHVSINNLIDLSKLYGSKYVFSTCKVFPEIKNLLDDGKLILFTGTPCQVLGLKTYLKNDYQNLYTIDNICHGAPSNDIWKEYLHELNRGKKVNNITFRSKENGWRHYRFVIDYDDGTKYDVDHNSDLYMRGFIDNLTLREACYNCNCKGIKNRVSDITLGDLWGVWDFLPQMDDDKGTSLLFINSEKGKQLLSEISDSLIISKVDEEQAIAYNKCAVEVSKKNFFREKFIKEYKKTGDLISCLKKYAKPNIFLRAYKKLYLHFKK